MKEIYRLLISLLVGFISFWVLAGFSFGQCFGNYDNQFTCQILSWANLTVPVIAFLATFLFLRYKAKQDSQQQIVSNSQQQTINNNQNQQPVAIPTDNSLVFIIIAYMCLVVPFLGYIAPIIGLVFGFIAYRKTKSENGRIFSLIAIILLSLRFMTYVIAIVRS